MACSKISLCRVLPLLLLSACNITTPAQIKTGQMIVADDMKTARLDAGGVSAARVGIIADDYQRNGKGALRLVMPYAAGDPLQEVQARKTGDAYRKAFTQNDVNNITVDYVGVPNRAETGEAVVSYMSAIARPPADCTRMPGYQGAETREDVGQYAFGCETQTAFSKMISHPEDLMGRAGVPDNDSRRAGAVTEPYKAGKKNEPLKGIAASDIGAGG